MDRQDHRVTLYCSQTREIVEAVRDGAVHRAKVKFIREKYGEVSHIFMTAYDWYASHATAIVPRPESAESGIWAFADLKLIDRDDRCAILKLNVPADRAALFRMSDWNRILNLRYLGEDAADAERFAEKLAKHGVREESDVFMKPFYPQLKQEVLRGWDRLFRHDGALKRGEVDFPDVQAGLWEIRGEWVEAWDC